MIKLIDTYQIPTYAICAIVNGDYSGLNDDDERVINEWLNTHFPNGFIADFDKGIENPYFSYYPAFGGGSEVIDVDFYLPQ